MTRDPSTVSAPRGTLGVSRARRELDFDGFYLETSPKIYRLGWLLAGEEGSDLAAEAYVRALARWTDVSAMNNPEAWVRKVLVNLCTSWRRHSAIGRTVFSRAAGRAEHEESFGDASIDRLVIADALRRLSPRQRAAVVLRHYGGLSLVEVAKALGCRTSTADSHLRRAYATLSVVLGPLETRTSGGTVRSGPEARSQEDPTEER